MWYVRTCIPHSSHTYCNKAAFVGFATHTLTQLLHLVHTLGSALNPTMMALPTVPLSDTSAAPGTCTGAALHDFELDLSASWRLQPNYSHSRPAGCLFAQK